MFRFCLAIIVLFTPATGYLQSEETLEEAPYLEQYKRGEFPSIHKTITPEHKKGFPPQLREIKLREGVLPAFEARSMRPASEVRAEALGNSQLDTRVTEALGKRFVVIGGGEASPVKERAQPDMLWIEFYSYSNNRALKVRMIGDKVIEVQQMPESYQPPESHEEVNAAAGIVQKDPRYKDIVGGLTVRGIQTPSENRNRHLYLLFYKEDKKSSVFWAIVDMTLEQVVKAKSTRQ